MTGMMNKRMLQLGFFVVALLSATDAMAQLTDAISPSPSFVTKKYGSDTWQVLQLVKPPKSDHAPLVVMVVSRAKFYPEAGMATNWLTTPLRNAGFAVARVSHKPSAQIGARAAAAQVAHAIAYLKANAAENGIDADHILLVGMGTGADSISLLGCDPSLLSDAGVDFNAVRGVMLINGAYMDAVAEAATGSTPISTDSKAYGTNPADQRVNSAIGHLDAPNVPSFMIFTSEKNAMRSRLNDDFAKALSEHGVNVERSEYGRLDTVMGADRAGQMAGNPVSPLLRYARSRLTER